MRRLRRELVSLGGRVVAGMDAGIFASKPDEVLAHGVEELRNLGLSLEALLAAITSQVAIACGVEGRKGRVRAGADADLLVVAAIPSRTPRPCATSARSSAPALACGDRHPCSTVESSRTLTGDRHRPAGHRSKAARTFATRP